MAHDKPFSRIYGSGIVEMLNAALNVMDDEKINEIDVVELLGTPFVFNDTPIYKLTRAGCNDMLSQLADLQEKETT